jgi:hypothetical protein
VVSSSCNRRDDQGLSVISPAEPEPQKMKGATNQFEVENHLNGYNSYIIFSSGWQFRGDAGHLNCFIVATSTTTIHVRSAAKVPKPSTIFCSDVSTPEKPGSLCCFTMAGST